MRVEPVDRSVGLHGRWNFQGMGVVKQQIAYSNARMWEQIDAGI
jgi:hypothetical protein